MMKRLFHFLGSVRFALVLISLVTLFVILGTLLESYADSHDYAARYTYRHPFFLGLMGLFFVNILFSALRRWPFRRQHIPFLITHLGLLMMLAGCVVKSLWGTQGTMGVLEGTASRRIFLNHQPVLHLEKADPSQPGKRLALELPLNHSSFFSSPPTLDSRSLAENPHFEELSIRLIGYAPHSAEELQLWIKDDYAYIGGLPPFPVTDMNLLAPESPLPVALHAQMQENTPPWQLMALRSGENPESLVKRAYIEGMQVRISTEDRTVYTGSLAKALAGPIPLPNGYGELTLDWDAAELRCLWVNQREGRSENSLLPLTPDLFGLNRSLDFPCCSSPSYQVDLIRTPTLLIVKDLTGDESLHAFDAHGAIHSEHFCPTQLRNLIVYEGAFRGYGCSFELPFYFGPHSRREVELARAFSLTAQLKEMLASTDELVPPLELLQAAAERHNLDLGDCLGGFLEEWRKSGQWFYPYQRPLPKPLEQVLADIDWKASSGYSHAAQWISVLQGEILPRLLQGEELYAILQDMRWPLAENLSFGEKEDAEAQVSALTAFSQQILHVAHQLPPAPAAAAEQRSAHYLSALLRAYGIHSDMLIGDLSQPPFPLEESSQKLEAVSEQPVSRGLRLETRVTTKHRELPALKKVEDNLPLLALELAQGEVKERILLSYDSYGGGLKWPALNGNYLLRFQPQFENLPYRIRLRDTRQINYASSGQAYAYESDLLIKDYRDGRQPNLWDRCLQACGLEPAPLNEEAAVTISMNNVYETWDAYRFYMANITPPQEVSAQRAQIVVNCDPGKYRLTYPGASLVALGILMLYWVHGRKKGGSRFQS